MSVIGRGTLCYHLAAGVDSVQSDTLCVSACVSRTLFGHGEFSSERETFMRENGIKLRCVTDFHFFWPGTLFSLASAPNVC